MRSHTVANGVAFSLRHGLYPIEMTISRHIERDVVLEDEHSVMTFTPDWESQNRRDSNRCD